MPVGRKGMPGTSKLFSKPGYAIYLAFLCLTLFCLPFLSADDIAGNIGFLSLYLFLIWLFLILNLLLIGRDCGEQPPSRNDVSGREA
jgi:hypothetical protein